MSGNILQKIFNIIIGWSEETVANYNQVLMLSLVVFFTMLVIFYLVSKNSKNRLRVKKYVLGILLVFGLIIDTLILTTPTMHIFILLKYALLFLLGTFLSL